MAMRTELRAPGLAHRGLLCMVLISAAAPAWGYEYDTDDATQGAGANAHWRATARWDRVDEVSTKAIHQHTTDAQYLTPMVSYVPEDPQVPSPRDVLGYVAGAEGHLTHPKDTQRYFEALAEASPRVLVRSMGRTEEDREMLLVIVSSEANLGRLDEFKRYTRRLADPREVSEAEAQAIAAAGAPIVHITAGLHSPETGSPEMVMELAYRLAVSNHPDIQSIRDNVVLLITPVIEVDGRARVVEWNARHLQGYDDRRYMPGGPPYWGKYVLHDNNRDGIQLTQKLTVNYLAVFNEWHTTYSLDLHESVPLLYVAGGTGPYNRTLDPIVIREWQLLAHWELAELQKHNLPGVWTWGFYTGWNPGYLLWITNNRNSIGRFYETFGNSVPVSMERDLTKRKFAGKKVTEQMWYRADPPDKKVMWSMRNNTNYMQSGVLASLTFVARNGESMLYNFWKKGRNSIDRGKNEPPHAWVIPREQRDPSRLAHLVNQLLRQGIEVHEAVSDFEVEEGAFASGDFVVRLDQPYGRHARNLLERQKFPKDAEHPAYDDVSWTLGLFYGVDTIPIEDKTILDVEAIRRVTEPVAFPGKVAAGTPEAYAIKHEGNRTLITARYALERYKVLAAEAAFEAGGETFPMGTWIIPARRGLKAKLETVAKECMLEVHALDTLPEVATHPLDLPRLALYHNWIDTQNDGWLRFTFEDAGVPYAYINDDTVRKGGLRAKYDVILMAHQRGEAKDLLHGRDTKFGPLAYTASREYPSHGRIDSSADISGGLGYEGMANLETFLDQGGTLLLMGGAGKLATDLGLLRNVDSVSGDGASTRGSSIQTKVLRRDHPIAYGYDDIDYVFRVTAPLFTVPEQYDHWIVVQYGTKALREDDDEEDEEEEEEEEETDSAEAAGKPNANGKKKGGTDKKKFLLSGFVSDRSALEKKGAILDIPRSAGGRVILYSFNPLHRHLNHHDHNYVFNAIMNWNDFPDPEPKDHPKLVAD